MKYVVILSLLLIGCSSVEPKAYPSMTELLIECGKPPDQAIMINTSLKAAEQSFYDDVKKYEANAGPLPPDGVLIPYPRDAIMALALLSGYKRQIDAIKRECPVQMAKQEKAYNMGLVSQ